MSGRGRQRKSRQALETAISWFLLACALDVAMTHILLHQSAAGNTTVTFVESNPLARHILHRWGLMGMVLFKASLSLLVAGIAVVVHTRRPWLALGLLYSGTTVVGTVVVYSVRLLLQHR
ncbi:MAG: hypothetical protein RIT02_3328 [Planctomycetota bacterium]|jgi:hypothetical protein